MKLPSEVGTIIPPPIAPPLVNVSRGQALSPRHTRPRPLRAGNGSAALVQPVARIAANRRKPRRTWQAYLQLQQKRMQALHDAPPWLISLIVHLIFLLVLAMITLAPIQQQGILLSFREGATSLPGLVQFAPGPIEPDMPTFSSPETSTQMLEELRLNVPIELTTLAENSQNSLQSLAMEALQARAPLSLSSADLTSLFSGRSGAAKQMLLESAGGTAETEAAVALGLAWLKRQQQPDGTWSMRGPYTLGGRSENKTAATSMALLAFMGAGSTHKSGEYRTQVNKGVRWLVAQQDRSGFMAQVGRDNEKMYAQAQATIALCELYAMTGDSWIRPYAQAACDFACQSQSPQGGWRYRPRFDSDTSVTGWFLMGLKSGQAGGLQLNESVFPKVGKYLDSVGGDYNSGYAYQIGHRPSPSMTAEGILCRQYLGWHRNMPGMAQGLGALVANHGLSIQQPDVYYWYYATQALHHYGGPLWEEWNAKLRVELPASQIAAGPERGSWSPNRDAWGTHAGRLYTTCLSLYCLEVYYRHLPLYDSHQDSE